jgi:hypothetical protein
MRVRTQNNNNRTSRSAFIAFKSLAQAARIEGGLCEFARTTTTPTLTPTPTTIRSTTITTTPTPTTTTTITLSTLTTTSTNYTCFHNSNGVFNTLAQAARIEGGLCEFVRAQQQHQSLGFS